MEKISDILHAISSCFGSAEANGSHDPSACDTTKIELADARLAMMATLDDCDLSGRDRLLMKIQIATSMDSLWMLRVEVFQYVARSRGETAARGRLAHLEAHFPGLQSPPRRVQ